jgi:hypothetical protein
MEFTLHKLPDGVIITSDEKIREPGKIYSVKWNRIYIGNEVTGNTVDMTDGFLLIDKDICKKVIAQEDEINFSALSEKKLKRIGWFDVEKLSRQWFLSAKFQSSHIADMKSFIAGFQKAQELLSDRMFMLEDINKAYDEGLIKYSNNNSGLSRKDFIQSLSQPKSWKVELEMEDAFDATHGEIDGLYPKRTDGKFKIVKLL